jgi:hypothetical protein
MPKLYSELASWFHLLSAPKDYTEEAEFARKTLVEVAARPLRPYSNSARVAEQRVPYEVRIRMTLTDLSAAHAGREFSHQSRV